VGLGILAAACLLGTQSRAGLVTLLVELSAMAWLIRTKSAKIAAGILIVCLIAVTVLGLYIKDSSPSGPASDLQRSIPVKTGVATIVHRLDIWKFTLTEIGKNWLVGIGYGPNAYLYRYGQEGETVEPGHTSVKERGTHNILLYLSLHVGVIGMVLFVWFYGLATLTTVREYRNAVDWTAKLMLAGMIVSMIGLFVRLQFDQMFVGSLAIFFWVLLAAAALHYPSLRQDASER
jgi:O-antigen ligase